MKINNIAVTKRDFESLSETIKHVRKTIYKGQIESADFMLKGLVTYLDKNLAADDLLTREVKMHDKVRITNSDDFETSNFIGEEGFIVSIQLNYEYPFEIEFENRELEGKNDWLWKAENFEFV